MDDELKTLAEAICVLLQTSGEYQDVKFDEDEETIYFYDPATQHDIGLGIGWA